MKTALRRLGAAAAAFALSACMLTGGDTLVTPGGAEDFPNTVNTLARIAAEDIAAGGQWEQAQAIQLPELPDLGGFDSLQLPPPQSAAKRAALAKGLPKAAVDTLDLSLWEVDQSPNRYLEAYFFGRVYAYAVDSTATYVRRDTVVAEYLGDRSAIGLGTGISQVIAQIQADPGRYLLPLDYRGAVREASGIVRTYRLRNIDRAGDLDQAEYASISPLPEGGSLRRWVKIHGAEGAFREAEAVPEEIEILRRGASGDTLEWTLARDADGDRRLWGPGDSGVADVHLYAREPSLLPEVARIRSFARVMFRRSAERDTLLQMSYQEERRLRDGRVAWFTVGGTDPEAVPGPGDTTRLTVDTLFASRDSTIRYTATYVLRTGSAPWRMDEHALLGYVVSKHWRRGAVFHALSAFTPATPVAMGQGDFEGAMLSTMVYYNGDTVQTQGSVTRDSLNLRIRTVRKGLSETYDVALDAAGKLLRPPVPVALPDASAARRRDDAP